MATKTANYNLTKPASSDLYDIAVQNGNMDLVDEALNDISVKHKHKSYTDLSQIGLTLGSETIQSIATALPDDSSLIVSVVQENAAIYPTSTGLLMVTRKAAGRVIFTYVSTANDVYTGFYNSAATTAWSGWIKEARIFYGTETERDAHTAHEGDIWFVLK